MKSQIYFFSLLILWLHSGNIYARSENPEVVLDNETTHPLLHTPWNILVNNSSAIRSIAESLSEDIRQESKDNPHFTISHISVYPLSQATTTETLVLDIGIGGKMDAVMVILFFRKENKVYCQIFNDTFCANILNDFNNIDQDGSIDFIQWGCANSSSNSTMVLIPYIYRFNGSMFVESSASYPQYYEKYLTKIDNEINILASSDSKNNNYNWYKHHISDLIVGKSHAQKLLGIPLTDTKTISGWVKNGDFGLKSNAIQIYSDTNDISLKPYIESLTQDDNDYIAKQAKELITNTKTYVQ
jgi:hypothetical protein